MSSTSRTILPSMSVDGRGLGLQDRDRRRCGSCTTMTCTGYRGDRARRRTTSTSDPPSRRDPIATSSCRCPTRRSTLTHRPRGVRPRASSTPARSCCCCRRRRRRRRATCSTSAAAPARSRSTMARRSPDATVWAVDVNERARRTVRGQRRRERHHQLRAVPPDEVPADVRFDSIWSNPPIRIGKEALHDCCCVGCRA